MGIRAESCRGDVWGAGFGPLLARCNGGLAAACKPEVSSNPSRVSSFCRAWRSPSLFRLTGDIVATVFRAAAAGSVLVDHQRQAWAVRIMKDAVMAAPADTHGYWSGDLQPNGT